MSRGVKFVGFVLSLFVLAAAESPAATYYVSTTGDDTANNGSSAAPWRTIQYGVNHIQGGDNLIVREGTYQEGDGVQIYSTINGAEGALTTIRAEGKVYIRTESDSYRGIIVEGTASSPIKFIKIEGFRIVHQKRNSAIYIRYCTDSVIENNTCRPTSPGGFTTGIDNPSIGIKMRDSERCTVRKNNCSYISGSGYIYHIGGGTFYGGGAYGIYLQSCVSNVVESNSCNYIYTPDYSQSAYGIYVSQSSYTIVRGNVSGHHAAHGGGEGNGGGMYNLSFYGGNHNRIEHNSLICNGAKQYSFSDYGYREFPLVIANETDLVVCNNLLEMGCFQIDVQGATRAEIRNNCLKGNWGFWSINLRFGTYNDITIKNNVFLKSNNDSDFIYLSTPVSGLDIEDNLFDSDQQVQHLVGVKTGVTADNCIINCNGFTSGKVVHPSHLTYSGQNLIVASIGFRNPTARNYQLLASSPCLTAASDGGPMGVYGGAYGSVDSELDGMPDAWENAYLLDPLSVNDLSDTDSDGLTDYAEYFLMTDPRDPDTDNDGMTDGWENHYGLLLLADDSGNDLDGDGLINLGEFLCGLNPKDDNTDNDALLDSAEDTDLDGVNNATEMALNLNPGDSDTDNDGTLDGDEDVDGDGISNLQEISWGRNPAAADYAGPEWHVNAAASEGGDGSAAAPLRTIQRAIDYVEALANRSATHTIYVEEGRYPEGLRIRKSDIRLIGRDTDLDEIDEVVLETPASAVRQVSATGTEQVGLFIEHARNVSVENLVLTNTLNKTGSGVRIAGGRDCALRNVEAMSFLRGVRVDADYLNWLESTNVTVEGCWLHHNDLGLMLNSNTRRCLIAQNVIERNVGAGMWMVNGTRDNQIVFNSFLDNGWVGLWMCSGASLGSLAYNDFLGNGSYHIANYDTATPAIQDAGLPVERRYRARFNWFGTADQAAVEAKILGLDRSEWLPLRHSSASYEGFGPAYYVDGQAAAGGDGSLTAPFQTIQAAVDAIQAESPRMGPSAVLVKPGTYNEGVWVTGSDISIVGLGEDANADGLPDAGQVVIDATASPVRSVYFLSPATLRQVGVFIERAKNVAVQNVKVRHAQAANGSAAIWVSGGSGQLVRNVETEKFARGLQVEAYMKGANVWEPAVDVFMERCRVNQADRGIMINSDSKECLINKNVIENCGSMGMWLVNSVKDIQVVNNSIRNNAGGIRLTSSATAAALNNNNLLSNGSYHIIFENGTGLDDSRIAPARRQRARNNWYGTTDLGAIAPKLQNVAASDWQPVAGQEN